MFLTTNMAAVTSRATSNTEMRFLGFVANIVGSERNISINIEVRGKPDGHLPGVLTICIENPEIPGRIQMERFIPVEVFRKKVIPFEVLPFSRSYRNDRNFLYQLFGLPVSRESEKFTGILSMVQLNPVLVFGAKNNTNTI